MSLERMRRRLVAPYVQTSHGSLRKQTWDGPAAADSLSIHPAVNGSTNPQTVTTGFTDPDYPRKVKVVAAGTAGDIAAAAVVLAGIDIDGNVITDTLQSFSVNTAGSRTSNKAFKGLTSMTIPAQDGAGCTFSVGRTEILGLDRKIAFSSFLFGWKGVTREATAPTLTALSTDISKCTVDFNSALDGTSEYGLYYITENIR